MRHVFRLVLVLAVLAFGAYLLGFWSPGDLMAGRWRSASPTTVSVDTGAPYAVAWTRPANGRGASCRRWTNSSRTPA